MARLISLSFWLELKTAPQSLDRIQRTTVCFDPQHICKIMVCFDPQKFFKQVGFIHEKSKEAHVRWYLSSKSWHQQYTKQYQEEYRTLKFNHLAVSGKGTGGKGDQNGTGKGPDDADFVDDQEELGQGQDGKGTGKGEDVEGFCYLHDE